jgi:hypothetical protein
MSLCYVMLSILVHTALVWLFCQLTSRKFSFRFVYLMDLAIVASFLI